MDGRRILARYIREQTSQARLAREVECSETHLTLYLQGKRGLSITLARRISKATGGEVPVSALVPPDVAKLLSEAAA
jgi:transcriptional regulator with XRE-family HTH domain